MAAWCNNTDQVNGGMEMTKGNKFVAGLAVGAIAGSTIGLLLAPKTGKETRQMVSTRAGGVKQKVDQLIRRGKTGEGSENNHVEVASR